MQEANANYYFTWLPNNNTAMVGRDFWKEAYNAIFNTNVGIEILNKIPVSVSNKKEWELAKGSAHFVRAWSFLSVAWLYANTWHQERSKKDLGAVIDLDADFLNKLSRSTVDETYAQILKDAQEAVKYLPMYPDNPVRPSRLAAYGLLARIYLSMRRYEEALQQCNLYLAELNALLDYNNPAEVQVDNDYPFSLFNKEVIYNNASVYSGSTYYPLDFNTVAVDTAIIKSFHDNDLRKKAFFKDYGEFWQFAGSSMFENTYDRYLH